MYATSGLYDNKKLKLQYFNPYLKEQINQKIKQKQEVLQKRQNAFPFMKKWKQSHDKFFERGKFKREKKVK